jgi:hypothetical protein
LEKNRFKLENRYAEEDRADEKKIGWNFTSSVLEI